MSTADRARQHAAANSAPWLRAIRLTKWYGKISALQDVSMHLESGVWGLLGPNGSGKTTFLRLAGGQLKPSLGEVQICGDSPFANSNALRRIGWCPESDAMYDELSAIEFVSAMARLSGFNKADSLARASQALDDFGLRDAKDRKVGGYSRGMRQRAKLAQSLVHDPDIILLDEPLTGTDPTSRAVILDNIRKRADAGALVLFSTHVLHEVESLTDKVLLIARGQLVAQGQVHEIRQLLEEHPHHIRVNCDRPRDLAAAVVGNDSITAAQFLDNYTVEFLTQNPEATYTAIATALVAGNYDVGYLISPDATLEALFHYLVERSSHTAGTGMDKGAGSHQGLATQQQKTMQQAAGASHPNQSSHGGAS